MIEKQALHLPGQQDPTFSPTALLNHLPGFQLHGLAQDTGTGASYLAFSRGREFALAKVDAQGAADESFGDNAILRDSYGSPIGDGITPGRRIGLLGERIVVGGMTEVRPGIYSPALSCYDQAGRRVSAFNGTGQLILTEVLGRSRCWAAAIRFETNLGLHSGDATGGVARFLKQPKQQQDFNQVNFDMRIANGRIYVVATGAVADEPLLSGFVFCIDEQGGLDPGFGRDGVAALSSPGFSVLLRSIAINDDWIYVAGGASGGHNPAIAARIDHHGQHDEHFGKDGFAETRQSFRINDVVVDSQQQVLGVGVGSGVRAIAVRFSPQGVQDSSFGNEGAYIPGLPYSALMYAAVDAADRLLFIGDYLDMQSGYLSAMVVRLTPQGQPDPGFADNGIARLDVLDAIGANLLVQADGKLLAGGYTDRHATPYAIRLHA